MLLEEAMEFCPDDIEKGKAVAIEYVRKEIDGPALVSGWKPIAGDDEDVYIHPIPNSDYSIRLFGKYMEKQRQYGLDFVRTSTRQPENSLYSTSSMLFQTKTKKCRGCRESPPRGYTPSNAAMVRSRRTSYPERRGLSSLKAHRVF